MNKTERRKARLTKRLRRRADQIHAKEPAFIRAGNIETVFVFLIAVLLALSLHRFVFQLVRVEGSSMLPTFYTDERVVAEKLSYAFSEPQRKDAVICRYRIEGQPVETVIKRVIGLPGDTVEIRGGVIIIDGQELDESGYWSGVIDYDMEPVVVPEKHIFVVGDNRNFSLDSRESRVGPIPYDDIIGKVAMVVWPLESFGRFAQ